MDKPSIDINFNTYPNIGIFTVGSSSYHLNKNYIPLLNISSRPISSGTNDSNFDSDYTEYSVLEKRTTNFIYTSKKRDNVEAFNDCVKFINLFYKAINREFTDVQYNASGVSASSTGGSNTVQKIVPKSVSIRFIESSDNININEIGTIWDLEPNPTESVNIDSNHSDISECCDVHGIFESRDIHDMLIGTMSDIIKHTDV
jgi:hypothetical protein